jgi:bifunctional DNA-binding transcriptional regulator/antitoxin component of YhaV-PrlF toxin-antitoxin module
MGVNKMNAPYKHESSFHLSVSPSGKVHLPAELRKTLSVEKGGTLIVHRDENGISLMTIKAHLASLRALVAPHMKGDSVEQFLADRKAEAARELEDDR